MELEPNKNNNNEKRTVLLLTFTCKQMISFSVCSVSKKNAFSEEETVVII